MPSILGIDNGLTVTKAVLFDADGTQLSVARRRVPQLMPKPRHVERDMDELWQATAQAIREAIATSGRRSDDIVAVAATAHGDGLYLLDRDHRPLGPGILSLDSRAGAIVDRWADAGLFEKACQLSGQTPHASAPSAILAWIKQHEPERFSRIGSIVSCKDWLRYCLTGAVGTDRTEASTSFTDVNTQDYSHEVLRLYGLDELAEALPPVLHSASIAGHVTAEAAALTGLKAGTPVAAGLHDVTASALGIGGHAPEVLAIVAGTYSINEVVSTAPRTDGRWFCRNGIDPGFWNSQAISPASATNYDWFLDTLCKADQKQALENGGSVHAALAAEIGEALQRPSTVLFHPYLFGSPHSNAASASFVGLHGWHSRADLLKAVLEGIVFNHRHHVEALRDGFSFREVRLTGGASRNPAFAQLFADALKAPVTVAEVDEAAAFGTALCAGAAVGVLKIEDASRLAERVQPRIFQPDSQRSLVLDQRYQVFCRVTEAMKTVWQDIEQLGQMDKGSLR